MAGQPCIISKKIVIQMDSNYFYLLDNLCIKDGEMISAWVMNGGFTLLTKDRKILWFVEVPEGFQTLGYNYILDWAEARQRREEEENKIFRAQFT